MPSFIQLPRYNTTIAAEKTIKKYSSSYRGRQLYPRPGIMTHKILTPLLISLPNPKHHEFSELLQHPSPRHYRPFYFLSLSYVVYIFPTTSLRSGNTDSRVVVIVVLCALATTLSPSISQRCLPPAPRYCSESIRN